MEGVATKEKPESKGTSVKFGWIKGVLVSADVTLSGHNSKSKPGLTRHCPAKMRALVQCTKLGCQFWDITAIFKTCQYQMSEFLWVPTRNYYHCTCFTSAEWKCIICHTSQAINLVIHLFMVCLFHLYRYDACWTFGGSCFSFACHG